MTTASTAAAVPGETVTYTVTVTDNGQTAYTGATVTDTLNLLDDATYNNDAAATSGTVSYASPVITWTGDLAVGASAVITYTVTVNNPDTGDKSLVNTVAASTDPGSSCPPGGSNRACSAHRPGPDPGADHRQDRQHGHRQRPARPSPTRSPSPTPGRPPTPARRSPTRCPACWAMPPTTTTPPPPRAPVSLSPARS